MQTSDGLSLTSIEPRDGPLSERNLGETQIRPMFESYMPSEVIGVFRRLATRLHTFAVGSFLMRRSFFMIKRGT